MMNEYGLNFEAWARMYELQEKRCLRCAVHMSLNGVHKTSAAVNYDSATKKVRGLVCFSCRTKISKNNDKETSTFLAKVKFKSAITF